MMPPPPPPPPMPPPLPPPPSNPHMLEANGTVRHPERPESPGFLVFINTVNTITQLLIGAVVFSACLYAARFSGSIAQHVHLCTVGYVLLMGQAILSFNRHAGWSYGLKHDTRKVIHIVMQISGSTLAIAGSLLVISDSDRFDANFQTTHGILGLVAMILTVLSLIGGILNYVFASKMERGMVLKAVHACLGATTITVAFICLCFGFDNSLFRLVSGAAGANMSIAITVGSLVGILSSVFINSFKRVKVRN